LRNLLEGPDSDEVDQHYDAKSQDEERELLDLERVLAEFGIGAHRQD
jgi:hypothetical protein